MRTYNNDDRGGWKPKKSFGKRPFGGDRGDRNSDGPEMHQTVCDGCGDECEVPFKPNGRKPVYCRSCFKKQEGDEGGFDRRDNDRGSDRGERRDFDRPRYEERPRYEDKPRFEKPRFEKPQATENNKAQFEMLNFKMDLIIKALQQMGMATSAIKPVKEAKVEKEMPKEEVKVESKEAAPEVKKEKAAKASKSAEHEGPALSKPIKIVRKKKAE
ncbi:MAG: CxxC-x17-CxxC domain-containing protein [Patescibacteria group bacterium]